MSATVSAAPRRVALVNLADDQGAGEAAVLKLREGLSAEAKLAAIPRGDLSRALESKLAAISATGVQLNKVRGLFVAARKAKAKFSYAAALSKLGDAETILLRLTPSPRVNALLAETNFQAGLVYAADSKTTNALSAFRTVRRLNPKRAKLDASRYAPSIVALYARAASAPIGNSQTKVTTTYDGATIYLDGRKIGKAPITIALSPGIHYIVATFKGHRPSGRRLELRAGSSPATGLRLRSLRVDEKAHVLRRGLLNRGRFLQLGRDVARLAQVDAVIIVSGSKKSMAAALYDTRSDIVGTWRSFASSTVTAMLAPLKPLPQLVFPDRRFIVPGPPKVTKKWHELRWVRVSGGVAAVAVTLIAISVGLDTTTKMTQPGGLGF